MDIGTIVSEWIHMKSGRADKKNFHCFIGTIIRKHPYSGTELYFPFTIVTVVARTTTLLFELKKIVFLEERW